MDQWGALIAAVVGAFIALVASWLSARMQAASGERLALAARREADQLAMTQRLSAYLAASYHGVLSLRDLALAEPGAKSSAEKQEVWPSVDRVNSALVAVRINDSEPVVAAVEALDRAMVTLAGEARTGSFTHDQWLARRHELIGALPEAVIDAARGRAGKPPRTV